MNLGFRICLGFGALDLEFYYGGMAEWTKASRSKRDFPAKRGTGVQIPLPPFTLSVVEGLLMWYVYGLKCSNNSLYIGITNDLDSRLTGHKKGVGAKYTKVRLPVKVVRVEEFPDKFSARKREIQLKNWRRAKKEWWMAGFPRQARNKQNPSSSAS